MSKQIVITDSNGKETVVEGNFENAVNVKLEDKPTKIWLDVDLKNGCTYLNKPGNWNPTFIEESVGKTKEEAVRNYIKAIVTYSIDKYGVSFCVPFLEIALKELKKYG